MRVIGLTGGIAAGKSTVSEALRGAGAVLIDADKVGHEAYRPGTETHVALVEAFGSEIVAESGEIDRRRLGAIVFADPSQRQRLQDIVWPRMKQMMRARLDELAAQQTDLVVIEAAVLFEAGWQDLMDEIWVVQVPEEVARDRLIARNGLSAEEANARIRAQLTNEERARQADLIIDNSGSVEDAREQVKKALAR
jgi:phosphopantetheine adenylyltransferase/dephospho-CoA kinase